MIWDESGVWHKFLDLYLSEDPESEKILEKWIETEDIKIKNLNAQYTKQFFNREIPSVSNSQEEKRIL